MAISYIKLFLISSGKYFYYNWSWHNKFIKIILKLKDKTFIWIDSYRIFPVSLDDLCQQFGACGKLSKYKEEYNNLDNLLNNYNLFNDLISSLIKNRLNKSRKKESNLFFTVMNGMF